MKPHVEYRDADHSPAELSEERSALGACLFGQAAEAARMLERDDFSVTANREIFLAICALVERGEAQLEVSLLAAELRARGLLEQVGGLPYLTDLDYGVTPERSMESRVKVLRECAERRRLFKIAEEVERKASDWTQPPGETLDWLKGVAR